MNGSSIPNAFIGAITGKPFGESMFASPDAVDGKVGVTNSGSGLTEFETRKRFKLK
jgi:hypothetical protein